jgi:hypothetical protein
VDGEESFLDGLDRSDWTQSPCETEHGHVVVIESTQGGEEGLVVGDGDCSDQPKKGKS